LLGGGGGSIDIGVHQMHWMRYVVGEVAAVGAVARTFEPLRALRDGQGHVTQQVQADVDDTYLATLLFERGTLGQLWWSWAMRGEPLDIPGAPALLGSQGAVRGGEIVLEDGRRLPLQDEFERALSASDRGQFFPLGLRDPYAIPQLDWLCRIGRGGCPATSGA